MKYVSHFFSKPPAARFIHRMTTVVPKFIQSSYYEIFLAELFPQVADAGAENGDDAGGGDVREQGLSDSIEDIRHDPEAVAERIAVAVAAAAARSEGRKEREDAANNEVNTLGERT